MGVISIIGKLFLRGINLELNRMSRALKSEFSKTRQEFEEHLQAINENTNEINANYEYIREIECKLDRISERLDRLGMAEQLAGNYVTLLIEKGIPILKKYIRSTPHLRLDPEFKTLQAKENVL